MIYQRLIARRADRIMDRFERFLREENIVWENEERTQFLMQQSCTSEEQENMPVIYGEDRVFFQEEITYALKALMQNPKRNQKDIDDFCVQVIVVFMSLIPTRKKMGRITDEHIESFKQWLKALLAEWKLLTEEREEN